MLTTPSRRFLTRAHAAAVAYGATLYVHPAAGGTGWAITPIKPDGAHVYRIHPTLPGRRIYR